MIARDTANSSQRKEGAYEDVLLMKILARHFEFIAKIDTTWLPSQEPFTAMVLALISVRLLYYLCPSCISMLIFSTSSFSIIANFYTLTAP